VKECDCRRKGKEGEETRRKKGREEGNERPVKNPVNPETDPPTYL